MSRTRKMVTIAATAAGMALVSPAASAGEGGGDGVPATLGILDYEPALLTGENLERIPGFEPDSPYAYAGPVEPYFGGENLSMFCQGGTTTYVEGAEVDIVGASGRAVSVINTVGAIADAKAFLADARDVAEQCTAPFPAGSLMLDPVAAQPKLKKAGDGVAVLATIVQSSGNAVFQIYVRKGKYFISEMSVVAEPQVAVLARSDLDRLTKAAAKHLADLDKAFKRENKRLGG